MTRAENRSRGRGIAWALFAAFMSALFMVPWKLAAAHGEVNTIVLVMLLSAALFNSIMTPLTADAYGKTFGRTSLWLALVLAVLTLSGNLASAAAIARISGPMLSLLQRGEVMVVAVLAWVFIRERVDRIFWLGTAVAGVGLYLVLIDDTAGEVRLVGMGLGVVSATCFASMSVLTRKYIARIEPVRVNALRLWISVGLWFLVYGLPPPVSDFNPQLVLYSCLAALCGPGLARLSLMFSARYVEARITAMVSLAAPVFTLGLSFVVIGTWPSSGELLGGVVLLMGIAIPVVGLLLRGAPGRTVASS